MKAIGFLFYNAFKSLFSKKVVYCDECKENAIPENYKGNWNCKDCARENRKKG